MLKLRQIGQWRWLKYPIEDVCVKEGVAGTASCAALQNHLDRAVNSQLVQVHHQVQHIISHQERSKQTKEPLHDKQSFRHKTTYIVRAECRLKVEKGESERNPLKEFYSARKAAA